MKKLLCLLLCAVLLTGTSGFLCSGAENNQTDIESFSSQAREMLAEYGTSAPISKYSVSDSEFETRRLIVKSKSKIDTLNAVSVISGYKDLWVLQFESVYDTRSAYGYYTNLACVEYAEPDSVVYLCADSTPKILENGHLSWGSEATGADEAIDMLSEVQLSEVKIAVIDSGIDYNHKFLKDRLTDKGLNFSASGNDTAMNDDPESHGTHVAGIIADNSPDTVKIRGYKVFDCNGEATNLGIISAVDQAIADGMDILNLSFGGNASKAVKDSFIDAYNSGAVLVAASGNDGKAIGESIPACLDEAIVVAASNPDGTYADFSGYGGSVDITAPGVDIYSTYNNNKYGNSSGTSMAAPFASAGAAMLLSVYPEMTVSQVEQRLRVTAAPMNLDEIYVGSGMLDIVEAINPVNIPADFEEYKAAVACVPVDLSIYTDESVAALQAALAVNVYDKSLKEQDAVDAQAKAVADAVAALRIKKADYSAVEAALAKIPSDLSVYTEESSSALLSITENIDYNLDITKQAQVDKYAADIIKAVEELEEDSWFNMLMKKIAAFFEKIISAITNIFK